MMWVLDPVTFINPVNDVAWEQRGCGEWMMENVDSWKPMRLRVPHLPSWEVGTRKILLSRGKNAAVSMLIMSIMCMAAAEI